MFGVGVGISPSLIGTSVLTPVNTVAPAITGTAQVGSTLTCSTGTWLNSPSGYHYQWYENSIAVGTDATTYSPVTPGSSVYCVVTAYITAKGSAAARSNTVGPVVGAGLATPTLTNSSSLGAAPLVLSWSSSDFTAGMYGQLEIDQTSNAFGNLTQNIIFFIDGASWALNDESINLTTPSGAYWARIRTVRENESGATSVSGTDPAGNAVTFNADVSSWSTTFNDTISASVAVLSTTNGTTKNSLVTVTGSPALSWSASSGSAKACVSTTVEQASSHAQFEVTQVSGGATANYVVGIHDGTSNLNSDLAPGISTNTGIALNIALGAYLVLNWNSSGNQFNFVNNVAGTVQDGDIFTLDYDYTNGTMDCWRTRSGVTTKMGGQATGLPALTHHYGFAGTLNTTVSATMNFGGSAYSHTPGAGVAALWA